MKERTKQGFLFKYIFIALLSCIVYLGVKGTFCDVHVVSTGHGSLIFLDDESYQSFTNNTNYASEQQNAYYYPKEEPTAQELLARWSDSNASSTDKEKAYKAISNSIIVYHACEAKTALESRSSAGHSYSVNILYANGTTSKETWRTSTTYANQWTNQNGYKTLEEISNSDLSIDEETNEYLESLMKDFRTFATNLGTGNVLSKNDVVKQRLQEFCLQAGMNREIAYGLMQYALQYGDSDIKELISSHNSSGSVNFEDYGSKSNLTAYDKNKHKPFYYFIYHFYECDVRGQKGTAEAYEIDDLDSYYIGIMGHITIDDIKALDSGVVAGIGGAMLKVLSASTDELAESVVQTLARDVCWGIIELLERAEEDIVMFSPTLERYLHYFGGVGTGKESDVKALFDLNNLFYYLGAFLLVLLTVIQLVTIIVNPDDAKTDIPHLVARFIVLAIFIYWGRYIIDFVFNLTNTLWNMSFIKGTGFADKYNDRKIFYKAINLVTYDYFGIEWTYSVVGVIFNCAIGFIIVKNVFMVLAECIERYIVAVLLYFTFPTALSFGVSNTTSNVLTSYFRMLGTQLFMLFMNLYFIKGFVILLNNQGVWANSFYGLIFVIAYLKVAQAFDSYLSSLGLSVAHTSGRMASELLGVGSTLLAGTMMLGRIGMSVGRGLVNMGARGAGQALSTGAILSGSQEKGALKAFNLGENLRTQGLRGLMGGTRLTAETQSRLNTAQTGLFGLGRAENFRSAMSGTISGNLLNANKKTNAQALMTALGAGVTANGGITSARFNALGGGATYSSSVTSANGRRLVSNGQLALSDSQLRLGVGTSGARTFGIAQSGDVVRGTIGYNTGARGGDSFKLNQGAINKVGSEYCVTNAEIGLGADFLANDRVRANTLDLASQGVDLTLTKQDNGRIMVSRDDTGTTLGFMSENGDKWYEAGIRGGSYSLDDLNSGSLAYVKPTETSEAIQITTLSGLASGNVQMTPDFMEKVGKYTNSRGESSNYYEEINQLKTELEEATTNYEAVATSYLDALHTEGSDERERFIDNLLRDDEEVKASVPEEWRDVITRDEAISMIPDSIEELEAKQTDNERDFWSRCIDNSSDYVYMLEYRDQCADIYEKENAEYKAFCNKYDFDEEATVAIYVDKADNDTMYATEIHPTTEKESDTVRTEYAVTPLDVNSYNESDGSSVLKGDEWHVHDRDFHKYGNNRKGN